MRSLVFLFALLVNQSDNEYFHQLIIYTFLDADNEFYEIEFQCRISISYFFPIVSNVCEIRICILNIERIEFSHLKMIQKQTIVYC